MDNIYTTIASTRQKHCIKTYIGLARVTTRPTLKTMKRRSAKMEQEQNEQLENNLKTAMLRSYFGSRRGVAELPVSDIMASVSSWPAGVTSANDMDNFCHMLCGKDVEIQDYSSRLPFASADSWFYFLPGACAEGTPLHALKDLCAKVDAGAF